MKQGILIWITGLAGCGKSTIAHLLQQKMWTVNMPVVLIDGDVIRKVTSEDLGYSRQDRLKDAYRKARLCNFLTQQGIDVICATISLFHEIHRFNRSSNEKYIEILLQVDRGILEQRKPEIYRQTCNVWGIDLTPEWPQNPELIIINHTMDQLPSNVDQIWQKCHGRFL